MPTPRHHGTTIDQRRLIQLAQRPLLPLLPLPGLATTIGLQSGPQTRTAGATGAGAALHQSRTPTLPLLRTDAVAVAASEFTLLTDA